MKNSEALESLKNRELTEEEREFIKVVLKKVESSKDLDELENS
jgi:hypothetical protein